MKTLSRERKIMLVLLTVGILLSAFFGLRAARSLARLHQDGLRPGETDVNAIRGWMTVPYIAKVYHVPPDYLYQQIGVPPAGNNAKSLGDLNREYFFGQPGVVLQKVKDAILRYQKPASGIHRRPRL
jgi:hypothetical protein